jgi:hypothetical protein
VFIKQCNALNAVLPELFETTNDYTELLLTISYTDQNGVVAQLVKNDGTKDCILEEDFKDQVQIIGCCTSITMYERKNEVINIYKAQSKKRTFRCDTAITTDW